MILAGLVQESLELWSDLMDHRDANEPPCEVCEKRARQMYSLLQKLQIRVAE